MNATQVLFWFLSVLALFGAIMVVVSKNPVHSVLWLIVVFFRDLRALYIAERAIPGDRKPDRVCRSYYGTIPVCDHAHELKCGY